MFAPSINVDLAKLKDAEESKPPERRPRKVAARGRGATPTKAQESPPKK